MAFDPSSVDAVYWWEQDEDRVADVVIQTCKSIEEDQRELQAAHCRHVTMYWGKRPAGWDWASGLVQADRKQSKITRNLIRSVCDTAVSLIAKTRPKASVVTDGGDWDVQQKARDLDQFLVGAFNESGIYQVAPECFRDATIYGTGAWYIRRDGDKIRVERVPITELIVDEAECVSGLPPSQMFRRYVINVEQLARLHPEYADALRSRATEFSNTWTTYRELRPRQVVVVEAWRVGPGGRYVKCVEGITLEDKPWEKDWFPFVPVHWSPNPSGWYGQGLAELLAGRQERVNEMYRFITKCQELISVPRVFVDTAGGPLKPQLTNDIGIVVANPGGRPPTFHIPPAVSPEIYNWLNAIEQASFDEAGISQYSASNQLPKGIESAPAQREYSYKEGQRFAPISQRYEDAYVLTAYRMVEMYRDMYADGKKAAVVFHKRGLVERIEWKDVDLENERYLIRVEASSMDSLSPAGRMQAALELIQGGLLSDQAEARRLIGHPDLERSDYLTNANIEDAEATLKRLIKGERLSPVGYQNLEQVMEVVRAGYLRLRHQKCPAHILDNLDMFMVEADAMMAPPPAPMMPGAAPGLPPGAPVDPNGAPVPQISAAAAQGLGVPFSNTGGGGSMEGI